MTVREELSRVTGEEIMISDNVTFLGQLTIKELIEQPTSDIPESDTQPDVLNRTRLRCRNSGPVSITNFRFGQHGQEIKLRGDGQTTIVNGSSIKTNTAANKLLAVDIVYSFTLWADNIWVEE